MYEPSDCMSHAWRWSLSDICRISQHRSRNERSSIGVLATQRDERGAPTNTVFGVDADFSPTDKLNFSGFLSRSRDKRVQGDETVDDVDFDDVEDIDIDEPDGWDCTDVGGGLQYCEPATGASPGAGA